MKPVKKKIALILCALIAATAMSFSRTADVHAISFVEFYTSVSGEILSISPAPHGEGWEFVYLGGGDRISRLLVGPDTFVLGKSLEIGDIITSHFPLSGAYEFESFESVVSGMEQTETPGRYIVHFEHGENVGDSFGLEFIPWFYVDFNRDFLSGAFKTGDIVRAYYSPWGTQNLFDIPQYPAFVIVNGDYNIFVGAVFEGNLISNSVFGDDGMVLNIGENTEILTREGGQFPYTDELLAHDNPWRTHLAVVYSGVADSDPPFVTPVQVIVLQHERLINEPEPGIFEITLIPQRHPLELTVSPHQLERVLIGGLVVNIEPPVITVPQLVAFPADIPSPWAIEQVMNAIAFGLVPQELWYNFTETITRAEFAALAVSLYETVRGEITGRIAFTDANDVNVEKAAYAGIVSGVGNNRFDPGGILTREQAAVMLSNLADAIGQPLPLWLMGLHPSVAIADYDTISPWAAESVARIYQASIMRGVGGNRFAPQQPFTREQGIVTIMRMFEYVVLLES